MNGKKAKKLRRELMTHDQWLKAKTDTIYVNAKDKDDRDPPCAVRSPSLLHAYKAHKREGKS